MRIPPNAPPDVQAAFRELWAQIDTLTQGNINLAGRRITNAGAAQADTDYVTRAEAGGAGGSLSAVDALTVRQLLTVVKKLRIQSLGSGTAHFGIVYVDSQGVATVTPAGTKALTFNPSGNRVEFGTALVLLWLTRAGLASPSTGVVKVVSSDGTTAAELDAAKVILSGEAGIVSAGAGELAVCAADGTTPANINAATFKPTTRQIYSPTSVTLLRGGDFSSLTTDQVRSIVGSLITDLTAAGLISA